MTVPTKGIHVQSAMRWLFETLLTAARHVAPFEYNDDAHHFGGGSENMKLLYCAVGYIGNHNAGRERLINWYVSEQGHGGGEPLTVSHCQLHIGGHGAIALHAHKNQDYQVRDLAIDWLSIEYHLLSLCEIDGEPWTPGARGVKKSKSGEITLLGSNPTRGKFLRSVRSGKAPRINQYDLGACCVAMLPLGVRDWITKEPDTSFTIQGDLSIIRNGDRFAAVFDSLPIKEGGIQSAGYDGVDRWIYRDAGTPEVASKIIQLTRNISSGTIHEKYNAPESLPRPHPRPPRKKEPNMAAAKIPTTIAELEAVAQLPFNEANSIISKADPQLVTSWGSKIYPNWGNGYLHSSDHKAALRILLNREPSYREVYDSYHGGSKNIDLAREKSGAGLRPSEWDSWNDESKRYAVLVHLYGISKGSKILDGKAKDPDPAKTRDLMILWGLTIEPHKPIEPKEPEEPNQPTDPDHPPVSTNDSSVEVYITIGGRKRIYRCAEIK